MSPVHNFNAGPAVMPRPVLETLRDELLDYRGTGLSVLEMSHRSAEFADIATRAEADLRALLAVPDDFAVLFMQGGATAQFAFTVMNLAAEGSVAFAETGLWSRKARATAKRLVPATLACEVGPDPDTGLLAIPHPSTWTLPDDAAYLHLCDNETVDGVAFDDDTYDALADVAPGLPIVADMSSSILSRPVDVSRHALIYAGAQKNVGPAGLTILIASPETIERSRRAADLPGVFSYAVTAGAGSMLNTPPTFAWYAAGLVFGWLLDAGGLDAAARRNRARAARVYAAIDGSDAYSNAVDPRCRSIMNAPFTTGDPVRDAAFLDGATAAGLVGLKGHKSVGGLRASLYNAQTDAAVDALVAYMSEFAA